MSARPALGLFLTDKEIEISEVSSDGLKLEKFGTVTLKQNLVVNGEIQSIAGFVEALKELMSVTKPHPIEAGEEVVLGISDNRVFLREFTLPTQAGKEIEEAVDFRVRSLQPMMPGDMETDWQIIGRDTAGQIEVLLAAVPKKIIESYHQAAEAAGLVVVAVEPAVFANVRIVDPDILRGKNQLLVHVSANYAEFTYLTSGNPRFSDFLSDVDIAKKGTVVDVIVDYIGFANSKHPTRQVQEVVISGSHPQLEVIVKSLSERKIAVVQAKSRLTKTAVLDHGLLDTTHGLSLRSLEDNSNFNLLPLDFRKKAVRRRLIGSWRGVLNLLLGLTLLMVLGLGYLYMQLRTREAVLAGAKIQIQEQLSGEFSKELITKGESINELIDELSVLREAVGGEEKMLAEMSSITPVGVTLTSIVFSRGPMSSRLVDPNSSWMMVGKANSREQVLEFYQQLIGLNEFSGGRLFFGSLSKETAITFRIASSIKK